MKKTWIIALVVIIAISGNAGELIKTKIAKFGPGWKIPQNYSQKFLAKHPDEITVSFNKHNQIGINQEKTIPGKCYRLSLRVKGVGNKLIVHGIQAVSLFPKKTFWNMRRNISSEWRQIYFYSNPGYLKDHKFQWKLQFIGDGELALKDIEVEQLNQDDLSKNLLPNDGLNVASWVGRWGKTRLIPQLVAVNDSSFGDKAIKVKDALHMEHLATIDLPAIPGAELVAEFWMKSDAPSKLNCQVTNGLFGKKMSFGLYNEWKKMNYSTTIPDDVGKKPNLWLMFFRDGQNTCTYYISKFDIHYNFTKSKPKQEQDKE